MNWKKLLDTLFVIEHHKLEVDGEIIHGFFLNPIACLVWASIWFLILYLFSGV